MYIFGVFTSTKGSHRSFTSADGTFFESTAYYSPNSSPAIPTPLLPLPVLALSIPPHTKKPTRPLQVYFCCTHSTTTTPTDPSGLPPPTAPGTTSTTSSNGLPVTLCKGKRSCTAHLLAHSLSYQYLSPNYPGFSASLSSVSILNTHSEAIRHSTWKMVMDEKMSSLISRGIWELVEPPHNADVVACRWFLPSKFGLYGTFERYKAHLVAKSFTKIYGLSDVSEGYKKCVLIGDLNETLYMEQPLGYVTQGEKQRMVAN
ncbi:UNVERIFIED_CONTAM: hypothetical protein Sradi_1510000 [Sesamum radiatum]|uniref:Uncharacterized protein n=1 Tax=Sesamum radiatum TaxID=300843 RepID=A0AAW2U7M2_SESRA